MPKSSSSHDSVLGEAYHICVLDKEQESLWLTSTHINMLFEIFVLNDCRTMIGLNVKWVCCMLTLELYTSAYATVYSTWLKFCFDYVYTLSFYVTDFKKVSSNYYAKFPF